MKIEGTVVELRVVDGGLAVVVVEGFDTATSRTLRTELPLSRDEAAIVRIGQRVNVEITLTTSF